MTTEIQTYESGLSNEKHNALAQKFNPFMENVQGLIATAQTVEVTSAADVEAMKLARKTRLELRSIRINVENARKELKEASLREGKAIDGMANIIKFVIVPVEEDLQAKEDFVRIAEERRIADLAHDRTEQLQKLGMDCEHFDLGNMADEAFKSLLASAEAAFRAKKQAEADEAARIEAERVAAEKAEAARREAERIERERIEAENAKLRAAAAKAEKEAEVERKKQEAARKQAEAEKAKADAAIRKLKEEAAERERQAEAERRKMLQAEEDRKRKAEAERVAKEQAERDAELSRIKAEKEAEQARLAAPDAEKIQQLVSDLCGLDIPSVSSDVALKAMRDVRGILNSAVKCLRSAIAELAE